MFLLALCLAVSASSSFLTDSDIRNYIYQEWNSSKRLIGKCHRSHNCSPGDCFIVKKREVCLCPPGYFSEHGFCKEARSVCSQSNCKPGKCIKEFGTEKCFCPVGYTAKDDKCVEISLHVPGKLTTVMLMVIVAAVSVILTTLFGIGFFYYFSQRN